MPRTKKTTEEGKRKPGRPPKAAAATKPVVKAKADTKKPAKPAAEEPIVSTEKQVEAEPKLQLVASKPTIVPQAVEKAPVTAQEPVQEETMPVTPTEPLAAAPAAEPIAVPASAGPVIASVAPEPRKRGRPPKSAKTLDVPTVRPVPNPSRVVSESAQVSSAAPATVRPRRRWLRLATILVILVVLPAIGYYFYAQHKQALADTPDDQLIADVSERALLPTDEKPTVSTVVDAHKVNQEFLKGAQNGDKVLLYFRAGKAIVYRPSSGQIINMGPLQEPEPRVFLRKGSPDADMSKVAAEVTGTNGYTLVSQDESPNEKYTHTTVIDVAGNRPDVAGRLAQQLHATVSPMPAGETKPDADLLVIVGADN